MLKYHTVLPKVCVIINEQIVLMKKKLVKFDMERLTILYKCAAIWHCVNVYN